MARGIGNTENLPQTFRDLGFRTKHDDDAVFNAMGEAMVGRLARNKEFNEDRALMAEFQEHMMKIFRENPVVRIPGEFLYLGRVMGLLAGLDVQLGSQANVLEIIGSQLPTTGPASN